MGKREVPSVVRRMLDWDVKATNNVLAAVIKRAGPMRHYGTTLKGLEVSLLYLKNLELNSRYVEGQQ